MNPIALIRLEAARIAAGNVEQARAIEKFVRRGIRIADLGGGCGCRSNSADAQRKRQQLLVQDAKALIDTRIEAMTLMQLVTDYDLVFAQADADRIDAVLVKYRLKRNVTGHDLARWIETGLLPGASGKPYVPA